MENDFSHIHQVVVQFQIHVLLHLSSSQTESKLLEERLVLCTGFVLLHFPGSSGLCRLSQIDFPPDESLALFLRLYLSTW